MTDLIASYLLLSPTRVRVSHVRWWLDAWYEFERDVTHTNYRDNHSRNPTPPGVAAGDHANEDVNCERNH